MKQERYPLFIFVLAVVNLVVLLFGFHGVHKSNMSCTDSITKTIQNSLETTSFNELRQLCQTVIDGQKGLIAESKNTQILSETETLPTSESDLLLMFNEAIDFTDDNSDEDISQKSAALFENVFHRFSGSPEVIPGIWKSYKSHILSKSSDIQRTILLYKVFVDAINRAILDIDNSSSFNELWSLRQSVVEEQKEHLENEIANAQNQFSESAFRDYINRNLDKSLASEQQTSDVESIITLVITLDELNDDIDVSAGADEQLQKMKEIIASVTYENIRSELDDLRKEYSKLKDLTIRAPDDIIVAKKGEGSVSKLVSLLSDLGEKLTEETITDLLDLLSSKDQTSISNAINDLNLDCNKLAQVRYNIWVNRLIEDNERGPFNSTVAEEIATVDRNLLHPAVDSLYFELQQKILRETTGIERVDSVKAFTLKENIVTLESF